MKNYSKKVLITGATGGIGKALCDIFVSNEFTLLLTSSSDIKISELKESYGENNFYFKVDISNTSSLLDFTNDISNNHKDLSVIINNAGITKDNLILRMKTEEWQTVIKTNLESSFQIIKSLLPNMLSNRYGKIIGISSVVATTGNAGQANYVASKSGMIGMYKSIALEVAKRNININVVSPGFISTNMTDKLNDIQKNEILSKIPMNRFGSPKDVAELVYFLSSDHSNYITGQNFNVNGGMLMF